MTTPLTPIPARHADLTGKLPAQALPDEAVQTTGDQSIGGVKTHTSDLALGAKLVASRPTLDAFGASCFTFDPSAAPAMQVGGQTIADGGGPENRRHFVWAMGTNLDGANRPIDPTKTACRYAMEYNYWNSAGIAGGPAEYSHEFHLPSVLPPTASGLTEVRPLSIVYGDTTGKAHANFSVSSLTITDEPGLYQKFGYSFINNVAAFTLYYNNGTGPSGTYLTFAASPTSDVMGVGRGSVPVTTTTNGSQISEKLSLAGVQKYVRGVDSGNGGQATFIGPTGTILETSWTASGVSHKWYQERLRVGQFGAQTAQVQIVPDAASTIGLAFKLATSQTEDAVKVLDSTNATVFRVGPAGSLAVGGGANLLKHLTATAALDFPSTASGATSDLTISLTGAALGDVVALGGGPASRTAGTGFEAWVSAADTVTVRFWNISGSAADPASATFRVAILKF